MKCISEELKVKGNICDIIEAYLKDKNECLKKVGKKYGNQFSDY